MDDIDSDIGIRIGSVVILAVLLVLESRLVLVLYFFFLYDLLALHKAPAAIFAGSLTFFSLVNMRKNEKKY